MESKINYHVLSMDEIVFDNRNKTYGAFVIRSVYEKNLLKAMFLMTGLFCLGMSSPAILRKLGLITQEQAHKITETIICTQDKFECTIFDKTRQIQKPAALHTEKSEIMEPEKKDKIKSEVKPETKIQDPGVTTAGATVVNTVGNQGGTGGGLETNGYETKTSTTIFNSKNVDQMPEFIGGQDAFERFAEEHLPYPEAEKGDGIEGTAKIQFVINEKGLIEQVSLAKSSGYQNLDAAAIKFVKSLPKYIPGKLNGIAVRVLCVLPIGFAIE